MSLINNHIESEKEYFYRISSNNSKLFYKRTPEGYKRIAKSKIPSTIVDKIKQYDERLDDNPMKYYHESKKQIEELQRRLDNLHLFNLDQHRFDKCKQNLEDRIKSEENTMKYYLEKNAKQSEKRYKEETRKYGGFHNYFKEKYSNYKINTNVDKKYTNLIKEKIIENMNTPKDDAKKKYHRWLVHNHPDKGGDTELCANIISEYNSFKDQ